MAHFNIKSLNYINSSKKSILFNIDYAEDTSNYDDNVVDKEKIQSYIYQNKTYFGEVCESDSMITDNFGSLYNITSAFIIHNMYNYDNSIIKTDIPITYNNINMQDVYLPDINLLKTCQLGNEVFAITDKTNKDFYYNQVKINVDSLTKEYYYKLSVNGDDIKTYLFSNNEQDLINIFDPNIIIENINYNYIVDFPFNSQFNNYKNGYIYGNLLYGKNTLDSLYSMNISSINNNLEFLNCRNYIDIGKINNDQIYLKYRDNLNYTLEKVSDNVQKKLNGKSVKLYNANQNTETYTYQHIESIESINKIDYVDNQHKSNMYSLEIDNIGLNNTEWISEKVKIKLKQDIKNNIRTLVQTICPANTQLFEIYFTGN